MCPNITLYIYFINLQYFNLHKNSALYKLLWVLLIWILSSTCPFLTLSDHRFWLGRANPDGGRKDCRHVDHGQDVTGIQDANVERRCQEVHKLDHGKGKFDSKSVRWKSFLFDSTGHLSHIRLGQIFFEFYTICKIFTGKELNFGQKIPIFDHFQMS